MAIYLVMAFSGLSTYINSIRIISSAKGINLAKIVNIFGNCMSVFEYVLLVVVVLLLILDKAKGKEKLIGIVFTLRGTLGIVFAMSGGLGSGTSSGGKGGTCKSCHCKFEAGDAGGNYMSIARRGMCKNCYNNYNDMKQFMD